MTRGQADLIKFAALLGVAVGSLWYAKRKATQAAEWAQTRLNPAHEDNLVNQGVNAVVGEENVQSGFFWLFDKIDAAAEALGSDTGINGIEGQLSDLEQQ